MGLKQQHLQFLHLGTITETEGLNFSILTSLAKFVTLKSCSRSAGRLTSLLATFKARLARRELTGQALPAASTG